MARTSYRRAAAALLAVGMAALMSTACGSVGLLGEEKAPAGPPRPAGETQVITVEMGQRDNRLGSAVSNKRPGEEPDLKDARPEVGRTPTPRTSDTAGTIPTWEHWPTPTAVPPGSNGTAGATGAAGTDPGKQTEARATPARPVGAGRPANTRSQAAPTATPGEAASRKETG